MCGVCVYMYVCIYACSINADMLGVYVCGVCVYVCMYVYMHVVSMLYVVCMMCLFVCFLLFHVPATSRVISGWVLTCDSVPS